MSKIYTNFKKEECGLCANYASKREIHRGILLGDDIRVEEETAVCTRTGEKVRCSQWCHHFSQCGHASSMQSDIDNKKAQQQMKKENEKAQAILLEQQKQLEREADRIRYETERLEKQNRIAAMTPSQKRAYYAKKQREEAEEKRRLEKQAKEYEEYQKKQQAIREAKKKKNKKILKIGLIVSAGVVAAIIASVFIVKAINSNNAEKTFQNSNAGKLLNFIKEKSGGKNYYETTIDRASGGKATIKIEYKRSSFVGDDDKTHDWRASTIITPNANEHFSEVSGIVTFDIDYCFNDKNFIGGSKASYYGNINFGTIQAPAAHATLHGISVSQDKTYITNFTGCDFKKVDYIWKKEWNQYQEECTLAVFEGCCYSFDSTNILYKSATGENSIW